MALGPCGPPKAASSSPRARGARLGGLGGEGAGLGGPTGVQYASLHFENNMGINASRVHGSRGNHDGRAESFAFLAKGAWIYLAQDGRGGLRPRAATRGYCGLANALS